MTTNSLSSDMRIVKNGYVGPEGGSTWGLGFVIRTDAAWSKVPGSVGSFTWSGLWGCYFWVDPVANLVAIQLIQVGTSNYDPFWGPFRNLAYGAFLVPDRVPTPSGAPAAIEQAVLAAFEGTYRFTSTSSRDRQVPRQFSGIGLVIAIQDGLLKVVSPTRGGPAARASIAANDVITHLNDQATLGMTLDQALEKIRGPVNTEIRLTIARAGQDKPLALRLVRSLIRLEVGPGSDLQVTLKGGGLQIKVSGSLAILDFEKGKQFTLVPVSSNEFLVDSGDHTRLTFLRDGMGPANASCSILDRGRSKEPGSTDRTRVG